MQNVGIIVFPGFQVLDLAAVAVFEIANVTADEPVYEVSLLSEKGGPRGRICGVSCRYGSFQ